MVFTLICFNSKGSWHLVQSSDRRGMKVWISGVIPEAPVVAGVELLVTSVQPICLAVDSQSVLVPVSLCSPDALSRVVDLCCGMGGFSSTASRLGFNVQAGLTRMAFGSPSSVLCILGQRLSVVTLRTPRLSKS